MTHKYGITFNGIRKEYLVTLRGKRRPPWAPLERNLLTVPGMPGAHVGTTDIKPRALSIPVLIESTSLTELQTFKEDLADWLVTDTPKELIFDDEPDRVYFAMIDGSTDMDEIIRVGVGMLEFICADPYKYSSSKTVDTTNNPTGPIVLTNSGTAPTAPTFNVTLKQKTTYLDIIGSNNYMRIGKPPGVEVTPVDPKQLILWDQMNSLTGWVRAQASDIDGGTVVSGMLTNGYEFYQTNYGTGTSWHGDALTKPLGQSLTDFEVEFSVILTNADPKTIGRIELYLLDSNRLPVGKLSLKDIHTAQDGNYAELRLGSLSSGKLLISERGDDWYTWLNFDGMLRLKRVGNKWTAYVAKFVNGQHTARRIVEFIDTENKFNLSLAHVVVHIGANSTITPAPMKITDLKVYKLNNVVTGQIEYIGDNGDVFTFNHKTSAIYKNGELFMKKDFGSRFFPLSKGDNVLMVEPPEAITKFEAEWRDAYK
jgi:predicted phage tail component-like protein